MHNGAKFTPDALERVIVGLKDKGFELVPISKLIHRGEFTIDHTGRLGMRSRIVNRIKNKE